MLSLLLFSTLSSFHNGHATNQEFFDHYQIGVLKSKQRNIFPMFSDLTLVKQLMYLPPSDQSDCSYGRDPFETPLPDHIPFCYPCYNQLLRFFS